MQDKPTLCWQCGNACGNCSWSDGSFTPVDGWTAIPTIIHTPHGKRDLESFIIERCPRYIEDFRKYKGKDASTRPIRIIKTKKPLRVKPIKGTPRWRLMQMPDLQDRINRLSGEHKVVADLIFNYHYTDKEIAEALYVSIETVKAVNYKAFHAMEAME